MSHYIFNSLQGTNKELDKSTQRLIQAGFINQECAGIYQYTNLGLRVLQNISDVIRKHLDAINSIEVALPILQDIKLWKLSGRDTAYGKERFQLQDRKDSTMILAPTAEESALYMISKYINSYKQLPISIYQILEKYRDEMRPRFGLIRGRQFTMKDAYSFAKNEEEALNMYYEFKNCYEKIFTELELEVYAVEQQDTGDIGGSLSHEFAIFSEVGETDIYYEDNKYSYEPIYKNKEKCLELGHIFHLGTKYSESMNIKFADQDGIEKPFIMGCYGIGVSRLLSAIMSIHDTWPVCISPFHIHLIDSQDDLYEELKKEYSVLYDDRKKSIGFKLQDADLIGIPTKIIIGNHIELRIKKEILFFDTIEELTNYLKTIKNNIMN